LTNIKNLSLNKKSKKEYRRIEKEEKEKTKLPSRIKDCYSIRDFLKKIDRLKKRKDTR